jgi:hypothetical protein
MDGKTWIFVLGVLFRCHHLSSAYTSGFLNEEFSYATMNDIEDDIVFSQDEKYGKLTGDVQNWAAIIQNYIIQVIS